MEKDGCQAESAARTCEGAGKKRAEGPFLVKDRVISRVHL